MKTYTTFTRDNEVWLREVNPYQSSSVYACRTDEEIALHDHFEQNAIANAKVLLNPVEGKGEYLENELREVWQYNDKVFGWHIINNKPNNTYLAKNIRTACKYVQVVEEPHPLDGVFQNNEEEDGFFGLVDAVIDYRKTHPEPEYISPVQAERNRIIGLIEGERQRHSNACTLNAVSILTELLTLIKDGKE